MKKVITYGTFDQFHEGHIKLLERAKSIGDYLIVGVTAEEFDIQRGKLNVVNSLIQRIDNIRETNLADEIIIETHEGQKIEDIQKHHINTLVLGSDWRGMFDYLQDYCEVIYVERTKDISSTELRTRKNGIIKLGVVGTGRIAVRTMDELKYVSGTLVTAVYNPRKISAKNFAERFDLNHALDNYKQFLSKVDAVYVASPHETHYNYTKKALLANKHVLCEKPLVLKKAEAQELFILAEQLGLVLMEAVKTAYAPGFLNLISIAKSGRIGKIYDVEAAFTKLVMEIKPDAISPREYDPHVGGSFTELASYSLLPIIKLLGTNYKNIRFDKFNNASPVDIYAKAYLSYDDATATAKTGIGVKSEGQLLISGTKGYILVKSPWWLTKSFEVCYENPHNNENFSAPFPGYGMRFEIADFIRNINAPEMRNYKLSGEDSVAMVDIIERFINN